MGGKLKLDNIQSLIFDYDGTLHDSTDNYITAFKQAYEFLVAHGQAEPKVWQNREITQWLGYSSKDMWSAFMPGLSPDYQKQASAIIGDVLLEKVLANEANLYPGALETLANLKKKGYQLLFLSNCKEDYLQAHRKAFQLDYYFDALYCTENFGFIPKYEIFEEIKGQYLAEYMIIEDRIHDFQIGLHHEIMTVGCNYGFGKEEELQQADIRIDTIYDLQNLL